MSVNIVFYNKLCVRGVKLYGKTFKMTTTAAAPDCDHDKGQCKSWRMQIGTGESHLRDTLPYAHAGTEQGGVFLPCTVLL